MNVDRTLRVGDWRNPGWALLCKACEDDDTALLDEAISTTDTKYLRDIYLHSSIKAIENNAIAILNSLVERGADITPWYPKIPIGSSTETLELLLAHGWDINAREDSQLGREPFMWHVVSNGDLVKWCLEHGASVHPQGQEPFQDSVTTKSMRECPQILENVASYGTVATFELLRSKGAPTGWRSLHYAVEKATYFSPDYENDAIDHGERMAMVRHLLDVVGLDVNAPDQPAGTKLLPRHFGTPICYIPCSNMLQRDTRELTWLLLDRGADPTLALKMAEQDYPTFVEDVEAWKKKQRGGNTCCLQ